ncbi:MAG TPA: NAD(P)-dependent oxidoreductase [Gemmataceae bacterium]|nr:NAD(P)-dependent oxidoreductase [Gemmataceae bacterium]
MFFKDERVLVTGAAGLIGSNLVRRLVREGAIVRGTLRRKEPPVREPGVEYVACDLTRKKDCRAVVQGMRYVFHCAASTSGALQTASRPMVHVTPNVVMNALLLEAAYEAGVEKFLWPSSTTGYPPADHPVREEEMFQGEPFEKYFFTGWSKRFSEILCRMYGEKLTPRMTTIVLRPSNVYGPHDKFDFTHSHVTAALIRKVVERHDPIEVWGTGDDVRDLIYVDDFVEAALRALERLSGFEVLNIGLGKGYTVKQVLQTILELDGYADARIVFNPSRPTMIPVRLVDTSKAERLLGFRARTDLSEGLRQTIDWYRARDRVGCGVGGRGGAQRSPGAADRA